MNLHFYKYQGTGNDFIMVDNRELHFTLDKSAIAQLCDRRFGIGADGLILLQNHADFDFEMVYFNADGGASSMCGNGGRCIVAFAQHLKVIDSVTRFMAVDGAHEAVVLTDGSVELKMSDVPIVNMEGMDFVLNTGSPHYVRIVGNAETTDTVAEGRKIRFSPAFAEHGINVNFLSVLGTAKVATYERGVEDETLSCGTGVTASAIATYLYRKLSAKQYMEIGNVMDTQDIAIRTKGGLLSVRFQPEPNGSFTNIWLCGAATRVFEGFI